MATTDLGRLEPVDLREVWPNEETDFTPWLADQKNLAILGDALGMPLEFVAREEAVGPYSADILCQDSSEGTQVVGDNQLESTEPRTDQYRWLLERVEALHRVLAPRVKALPVPE